MKRPIRITVALSCLLILLAAMLGFMACSPQTDTNANGALGSPAASPTVDCSTAGHDVILKTIYEELAKSKYASQVWQFNITENNKNVAITGWSPKAPEIADLVKYVAKGCNVTTTNFQTVYCDLNANFRLIRTCPQNYYPCGDICIPVGENCIIGSNDGSVNSPNPYNCNITNINTNTNMNSNGNGNGNTKTNTKY